MPTRPLLQLCVPAHSIRSCPHAASSGDRNVASPPENQVPGMSAFTTAYPRAVQWTGSGDSKAVHGDSWRPLTLTPMSVGGSGEDGEVTLVLPGGGGMVGRAEREDVHRVQPAVGVAYLVPGELAADVGERVVIGQRGGLDGAVEPVRALVERDAVAGAEPEAEEAGPGQVIQLGVVEHDDLRVGRVGRDRLQGLVEQARQL